MTPGMKVRVCALMMTLTLLFAGCGQAAETDPVDKANELREQLSRIAACEIECTLRADYGDRVYEFALSFDYDADGESILTVLEPESISGLSLALDAGTAEIIFAETRLETGELDMSGLTPVSALPAMLSAWRLGYVFSASFETLDDNEYLMLTVKTTDGDSEIAHNLWVGAESFIPKKAEIICDGNAVIECEFTRFKVTEIIEDEIDGNSGEDLDGDIP